MVRALNRMLLGISPDLICQAPLKVVIVFFVLLLPKSGNLPFCPPYSYSLQSPQGSGGGTPQPLLLTPPPPPKALFWGGGAFGFPTSFQKGKNQISGRGRSQDEGVYAQISDFPGLRLPCSALDVFFPRVELEVEAPQVPQLRAGLAAWACRGLKAQVETGSGSSKN